MLRNERLRSQDSILEGLSHINESTLPSEVINNMGPKTKAFFITDRHLDLNSMKVEKVKSIRDDAYKTAMYRFYVMSDEWKEKHDGEGVLVAWDKSYSWNRNSKYEIWNYRMNRWDKNYYPYGYQDIKDSVVAMYVLPHDVYVQDKDGLSIENKQRERKDAQFVAGEPQSSSYYEPGTKEYRQGRKNELARENRKKNVGELVKTLIKKYGNLTEDSYYMQDSRYGSDLVQVSFHYTRVFTNLQEASFNISSNKVFGVKCQPKTFDKSQATTPQNVIAYGEGVAADAGDFYRLLKKIQEDKELKTLLSQI